MCVYQLLGDTFTDSGTMDQYSVERWDDVLMLTNGGFQMPSMLVICKTYSIENHYVLHPDKSIITCALMCRSNTPLVGPTQWY